MFIKTIFVIPNISISIYLMNFALNHLSDSMRDVKYDIANSFLFNIVIQSYVLLYYLTIGNSKSKYFMKMSERLVTDVVSATYSGVSLVTKVAVDSTVTVTSSVVKGSMDVTMAAVNTTANVTKKVVNTGADVTKGVINTGSNLVTKT